MAATISHQIALRDWPYLIREVEVSSITSDVPEDISHGGPTGLKVSKIEVEPVVKPTVLGSFSWFHDRANDSTTNDTCRLIFVSPDPAGMKLKVRFHFFHSASGGISAA